LVQSYFGGFYEAGRQISDECQEWQWSLAIASFKIIDRTKIKLFKPKCFSDGTYFSLEAEYINLAYVECTFEKIVAIIDRNFKIYNDYRKEFLKTKVEEL
jgi:hypothetical protein